MSSNNFSSGQIISGSSGGASVSTTTGRFVTSETQVTGVLDVIPIAQFNSSSVTVPDKSFIMFQCDSQGSLNVDERYCPQAEDNTNGVIATAYKPLAASTYAPSRTGTLNAVSAGVIKTSAGSLLSFQVTNQNIVEVYLMFANQTTTPTNGTTPLFPSFVIPPKTSSGPGQLIVGMEFFTQNGEYFSTGISWAVSSASGTLQTLVASSSLAVSTNFRYI